MATTLNKSSRHEKFNRTQIRIDAKEIEPHLYKIERLSSS